jgi:rhodanese-related sulfurtransferase
MDRISVKELVDLVEGGQNPIILDVRPAEARVRSGMIPGAVGSAMSETLSALKNFSRDAEIVIYCSCPNEASAAMAALHLKRAGFKRIRPLLGGIEAWIEAGRPIEIAVLQVDGVASAAAA